MKRNEKKENNSQNWIDIPVFVNGGNETDQSFNRSKRSIYEYDDSNSFVKEVNSSLAKQVSYDLDQEAAARARKPKKKKKGKALKAIFFTLLTFIALGCLLVFTPMGKKLVATVATEYIYGDLDYEASNNNPGAIDTNGEPADKIVNILLVGIEEIKNAKNTDSMIIATMNTETNSLKLTSLMRDLYVEIPGHDHGRLNSAYARGGIDLLYDTIEVNFGVQLDGYCMVNFDSFQQLVDMVGGVEVTLTKGEAKYLNTKNYISDPKNRNVKVGTQMLNGNQALGYCRIRKVSTSTESNDFGRTQRQRIVLKGIYKQIKKKNIVEQVLLMNKILNEIKIETDITKSEFKRYLEEAMDLKVKDLNTLRIPSDGNYENVTVKLGKVNQEVLQPKDWNATRDELHDFIFGTGMGAQTSVDTQTATGSTEDTTE